MRGLTANRGATRLCAALALLAALCLLGACARKVRVEVNSLAGHGEMRQAGDMAGKRCLVLPAKADLSPDDLQFREFAAQVADSLARKGCAPAQGLEDADLAALLDYSISDPVILEERGYVAHRPWGRWRRGAMADYVPVTSTYIFYTSSLNLEARLVEKELAPPPGRKRDAQSSGPKAEAGARLGRQAWKVGAIHIGPSADLRALFPWLLAAAKDYYGVDSGHGILVGVSAEDVLSDPPAKNIAAPPGSDAP